MSTAKNSGQGRKTHEEFLREVGRKADLDDVRSAGAELTPPPHHAQARQSEFPVSRDGMNQETRGQNKHNNPGQGGHKPQKHTPAEEKG